MGIFLDFIKLSYPEKILALESLFWVTVVRVMIWVFPFSFVQKRVQKIATYLSPDELDKVPKVRIDRIRMMIVIISRYIPRATCLVQANGWAYIIFTIRIQHHHKNWSFKRRWSFRSPCMVGKKWQCGSGRIRKKL